MFPNRCDISPAALPARVDLAKASVNPVEYVSAASRGTILASHVMMGENEAHFLLYVQSVASLHMNQVQFKKMLLFQSI